MPSHFYDTILTCITHHLLFVHAAAARFPLPSHGSILLLLSAVVRFARASSAVALLLPAPSLLDPSASLPCFKGTMMPYFFYPLFALVYCIDMAWEFFLIRFWYSPASLYLQWQHAARHLDRTGTYCSTAEEIALLRNRYFRRIGKNPDDYPAYKFGDIFETR